MCKEMLVIRVNRVVNKKRIIRKNGGLRRRRGTRGRYPDPNKNFLNVLIAFIGPRNEEQRGGRGEASDVLRRSGSFGGDQPKMRKRAAESSETSSDSVSTHSLLSLNKFHLKIKKSLTKLDLTGGMTSS
jgi:hypothetical protein